MEAGVKGGGGVRVERRIFQGNCSSEASEEKCEAGNKEEKGDGMSQMVSCLHVLKLSVVN